MTIKVTIKHDDTESLQRLAVTVVTVGNLDAADQKHELKGGEEVSVQVHGGQFVMVDETDADELHGDQP